MPNGEYQNGYIPPQLKVLALISAVHCNIHFITIDTLRYQVHCKMGIILRATIPCKATLTSKTKIIVNHSMNLQLPSFYIPQPYFVMLCRMYFSYHVFQLRQGVCCVSPGVIAFDLPCNLVKVTVCF